MLLGQLARGKTTLIDIMLGLLRPVSGALQVDGIELTNEDDIRLWQMCLSYVPQFIYLADSTIRENIAFGKRIEDITQDDVEWAAATAAIHNFIVQELPNGYDTIVGERGVKLSGGQIQRIGIARALYTKPKMLVLDEATSSLDGRTEAVVMEAVKRMRE